MMRKDRRSHGKRIDTTGRNETQVCDTTQAEWQSLKKRNRLSANSFGGTTQNSPRSCEETGGSVSGNTSQRDTCRALPHITLQTPYRTRDFPSSTSHPSTKTVTTLSIMSVVSVPGNRSTQSGALGEKGGRGPSRDQEKENTSSDP